MVECSVRMEGQQWKQGKVQEGEALGVAVASSIVGSQVRADSVTSRTSVKTPPSIIPLDHGVPGRPGSLLPA